MTLPPSAGSDDFAAEQQFLDYAYSFLDAARTRDEEELRKVKLRSDPDPQARVEREVEYHRLNDSLERYRSAEVGLVFGRIDIEDAEPDNPLSPTGRGAGVDKRYIGRLGLTDADDDYRSVVMDWRAEGARPFYLATTAQPEGVHRRRHLRTRGRTLRALDDEWLATEAVSDEPDHRAGSGGDVGSEAVLREVLDAARTGHMRGIVETIQREQDIIIRDATRSTLVVQGGPGTGKTAVALHRIAWLLYTYREQLARTGVLIIGPNSTFLDYISRVLPSLGESGVVLTTVGDFYPGVRAHQHPEPLVTQEVKGAPDMVEILRRAVRAYQSVPATPIEVRFDSIPLLFTPENVQQARARARQSRRPHNAARSIFREQMLELLGSQLAEAIGADPLGGSNLLSASDIGDLIVELGEDERVNEVLDTLWPVLTPLQVLTELLESPERIEQAAADYDDLTREALLRPADWPVADPEPQFSASDAPLLDELAELLGPTSDVEVKSQEWDARVHEAQDALDTLSSSASQDLDDGFDAEILSAYDVIDAETLAERHRERDVRTTAERAAADRSWVFGHVIVDEAQEVSAMAWRMIRRRSPNGWMTLVGDSAQTSSPAGLASWEEALAPIVGSRWHLHELSINYRTPAEIMDTAAQLLARIDPTLAPPRSIRATGRVPRQLGSLDEALAHIAELSSPQRLVAAIVPQGRIGEISQELAALSDAADAGVAELAARIQIFDVAGAKGLEFDEVIVVEPDEIVAQSPQGLQDLYVALTRATQGLSLVGAAKVLDAAEDTADTEDAEDFS